MQSNNIRPQVHRQYSIGKDTLDEAPFAYRPMNEILAVIQETATINQILKPVYNYKAGSQ